MTDDSTTEVTIHSFHPLQVSLPEGETVCGKVRIVLPPIHVQVRDLSMGGILPGAHLGADVSVAGLNFELTEHWETSKLMELVLKSKHELERVWEITQAEFNQKGALLG